jgi:hypothetical protein
MFGRVRGHGDVGEKRNLPSFVCKRIGRMDTSTGTFGLLAITTRIARAQCLALSVRSLPVAQQVPRRGLAVLGQEGPRGAQGVRFAGLRGLNGD